MMNFFILWLTTGQTSANNIMYDYGFPVHLARYILGAIVFVAELYLILQKLLPATHEDASEHKEDDTEHKEEESETEEEGFSIKYRYDFIIIGAAMGTGLSIMMSGFQFLSFLDGHYLLIIDDFMLFFFFLAVFLAPIYILCGMAAGYHSALYQFDKEEYPNARIAALIEPAFIFITYHILMYFFWTNYYVNSNQDTGLIFLPLLVACFVWWYAVTRKRSNKMLELDKEIVDSEPIEQETETETINQEQENK